MTQNLYYYESGYFDPALGYYVYTADAESLQSSSFTSSASAEIIKGTSADLVSQATQNTQAGTIKDLTSNLSSQFTQSAIISHIEGADLFAISESAISVEVSRLRDNNLEASSAFTIATSGQRIRYVSAEEDSAFSVAIDNLRVRYEEAALDAAFSLDENSTRIQEFASNLTSSSTQSTSWQKLRFLDSSLESNFDFACEPTKLGGGVVVEAYGDWNSNFDLTSTISHIEGADLSAFSSSSLSIEVDKFAGVDINLESTLSSSIDILRIKSSTSDLASEFNFEIDPISVISLSSNQFANCTLSSTILRIQEFNIEVSGAFTPDMNINAIKNLFSTLDVTTSLSSSVVIFSSLSSSIESNSSVSATLSKIYSGNASLSSNVSLSITSNIGIGLNSSLSIDTSLSAINYRIVQFSSTENSAFTPSLVISVFKNSFAVLESSSNVSINSTSNKSGFANLSLNFSQSISATELSNFWTSNLITGVDIYGNPIDSFETFNVLSRGQSIQDSDGNIYTSGSLTINQVGPYYGLIKLDKYGSVVWIRYSITSTFDMYGLMFDSDGNLIISVQRSSSTYVIAKLDPSTGNFISSQRFYSQIAELTFGEIRSSDSKILVRSTTGAYTYLPQDFSTISSFTTRSPTISGYSRVGNSYQVQDSQGNIYVVHSTRDTSTLRIKRLYLSKVNSSNSVVWTRLISYTNTNTAYSWLIGHLAIDSNNNIYLSYKRSQLTYTNIAKFDSSGNSIWNKEIASGSGSATNKMFGLSVRQQDNSLYALIYNKLIKFKPDGSSEIDYVIDSTGNDFKISDDGNYIFIDRGYNFDKFPANGVGLTFTSATLTSSTDSWSVSSDVSLSSTFYSVSFSATWEWNSYSITPTISNFNGGYYESDTPLISSSLLLSASANKKLSIVSSLSSSALINVNLVKENSGSANLASLSSLTTNLNKIQRAVSSIDSTSSTLITSVRIKPFVSFEDVEFNLSASSIVVNTASSNLQSNTSASVVITKSIGAIIAALSSSSTLESNVSTITNNVTNLTSQSQLISSIKKYVGISCEISSNSSLEVIIQKAQTSSVQLSSTATISTLVSNLATASSSISVETSLIADAKHTVPFAALLASSGSLSINGKLYKSTEISLSNSSSLSATGKIYRRYNSNLSIEAQQSVITDRYRSLSASFESVSSELIANGRIRDEIASLDINSTLTVSVSVISSRIRADLVATSSTSVDAVRSRIISSQLAALCTIDINSTKVAQLNVSLEVQGFILSTGRVVNLSGSEIYIIPRESLTWVVQPERRNWTLLNEERIWEIQLESRDWIIPNEDRTYIIKE